jgi:hypothetical protein
VRLGLQANISGSGFFSWVTGGGEKVRIDNSGRLLVGTSTASILRYGSNTAKIETKSLDFHLAMRNDDDTPYGHYATFVRSRNNAIVQNGDELGSFEWRGHDGTDVESTAASISAVVDGTPGANDMPGRLVFSTTADGASSPTERLRITSAGLVGIGTSSPTTTLHVVGSSGSGAIQIGNAVNTQYHYINFGGSASTNDAWQLGRSPSGGIGPTNGFYLYDLKSSATRLAVDTSGNVGIGTTSPAYAFVVSAAGASGIEFGPAYSGTANLIQHYSRSGFVYVDAVNDAAQHRFQISGTERARIDSSGRLLVGTSSSPGAGNGQYAKVVVQGYIGGTPGGALISLQRDEAPAAITTGETLGVLSFGANDGSTFAEINGVADGTAGASDFPGRLVFSTTADGDSSPTERLRITSAGFVGIGTSTPGGLLHVGSSGGGIVIDSTLYSELSPPTATDDAFIFKSTNDGTLNFSSRPASGGRAYRFWRGSNVSMIIDDAGNVGIGTTSPGAALEVINTTGKISARATTGVSSLALQIYNNGTDSYIDSTAYGAGSGGGIAFRRNGTVEMGRFDTSGRLLVGTSSTVDSVSNALLQSSASGGAFLALGNTNTVGAGAATLGQVGFYGYQGAYVLSASITANSDATWSSNDYPTRLVFSTTADGASSPTERMRITNYGTFWQVSNAGSYGATIQLTMIFQQTLQMI